MNFSSNIISPLDQFEVRDLMSLDAPILGNLSLSVTNIGLYLTTAGYLVLTISLVFNVNRAGLNAWLVYLESIYATVHSIVVSQIEFISYLAINVSLGLRLAANILSGPVYFSFACLFNSPPKPHAFVNFPLESKLTIKHGLSAIFIPVLVYILFKGILLAGTSLLNLHILIPFISGISTCLIFAIKEFYSGKEIDSKIILVFAISFGISVLLLCIKIIFCYDLKVLFLIPLFELITFEIKLGQFEANILFMDNTNSAGGQNSSRPELYNPAVATLRIHDILKELRSLNTQLEGFISQMINLKSVHDIRYIETNGALSLDVPDAMSQKQRSELIQRVSILDSLFARQSEAFKHKSDLIASIKAEVVREGFTPTSSSKNVLASRTEKHQEIQNRFKELFEKE